MTHIYVKIFLFVSPVFIVFQVNSSWTSVWKSYFFREASRIVAYTMGETSQET